MRQYLDFGLTTDSFLKHEHSAFICRAIDKLMDEVNKLPAMMRLFAATYRQRHCC